MSLPVNWYFIDIENKRNVQEVIILLIKKSVYLKIFLNE